MRLAYFDCFAGISGHMALGALVDAGADLDAISEALASLPVGSALFERERIDVHGLSATRVHIRSRPEAVIHTYGSIRSILDQADLPDEVRRTSQRIFRRLAEAEARVHSKGDRRRHLPRVRRYRGARLHRGLRGGAARTWDRTRLLLAHSHRHGDGEDRSRHDADPLA